MTPRPQFRRWALTLFCWMFLTGDVYAACINPTDIEGAIIYNAAYNVPQVCAGNQWVALGALNPGAGSGVCSNPTDIEGAIIYNDAHDVLQYCNGEYWIAVAGPSGGGGGSTDCPVVQANELDSAWDSYGMGIWQQGPYQFYTQDATSGTSYIYANDATGSYITRSSFPAGRVPRLGSIWGDGTYIYVGAGNYLYAFTFNGTTFTSVSANTGQGVFDIWGDGTYIYIANGTAGIEAWTFDGTTLAQAGSTYNTAGSAERIWANSTHQFAVDAGSVLMAFTFNGTAFTLVDSASQNGCCGGLNLVTGDSNYIYAANYYADTEVFELSGLTLNYVTDVNQVYAAKDGYLYTKNSGAVEVFSFDGTTATYQGAYALSGGGEVYDLNIGDDGNVYTMAAFGPVMSFAECGP